MFRSLSSRAAPISLLLATAASAQSPVSNYAPTNYTNTIHQFLIPLRDYNAILPLAKNAMEKYYFEPQEFEKMRPSPNGRLIALTRHGDHMVMRISDISAQHWMPQIKSLANSPLADVHTKKVFNHLCDQYAARREERYTASVLEPNL